MNKMTTLADRNPGEWAQYRRRRGLVECKLVVAVTPKGNICTRYIWRVDGKQASLEEARRHL